MPREIRAPILRSYSYALPEGNVLWLLARDERSQHFVEFLGMLAIGEVASLVNDVHLGARFTRCEELE